MKEFNMDEGLGVFCMSHLSRHVELKEVVKLVMILSHGNARLQSGFLANEEMLVEYMSEGLLVGRRMVFDGVMNETVISNVDVNRKMLKFLNNAHSEKLQVRKKEAKKKVTNELNKVNEA